MRIEHIFLDMDGVLVDFVTDALRVHETSISQIQWPAGEWSIPKILGISNAEFWARIDEEGSDFWANLKPYPWFQELIDLVSSIAPYSILTSPTRSPSCAKGKIKWITEHMPHDEGGTFRQFLIGPEKHLLSAPNRLLIDDSDANSEMFSGAGGSVIRFPRVWNCNHAAADDPAGFVRHVLDSLELK